VSETENETAPLRVSPVNPVLPVINNSADLNLAIDTLRQGSGSIAIDAERASGYRYFQRAYLIQLFRANSKIVLIDPIGLDISPLREYLNSIPWILHAATQDLPCLNELGLYPPKLFDTELAAKLLGLPKVGLASLTESLLNVSLAKEHSAVNWSIRPLQSDWLNYAALDVELLPDLKSELEKQLNDTNRAHWAEQEFNQLLSFTPNQTRPDQWRRTSGMHELPQRRQKAIVKEIWEIRDSLARQLDISPGRLLNDRAIIAITKFAVNSDINKDQLRKYLRGNALDYLDLWLDAINEAKQLPESELPRTVKRDDVIPNPKSWEEINPAAHQRWIKYRPATNEVAVDLGISPEVLISPDSLRKYCWAEDQVTESSLIEDRLISLGTKKWAAGILADKFESVSREA
jgi:ribonuclease D